MVKLVFGAMFVLIGAESIVDAVQEFKKELYFRAGVDTTVAILSFMEVAAIRFGLSL